MKDNSFLFGVIFFCAIFFGIQFTTRWFVWLVNLTGLPFDVGLGIAMIITVVLGVLGLFLFILITDKVKGKSK